MGVYSGNTTIAVVQDGQSNQYAIEVSNDSVYKFRDSTSGLVSAFSPEFITFSVYDAMHGLTPLAPETDFTYKVDVNGRSGYKDLATSFHSITVNYNQGSGDGSASTARLDTVAFSHDTTTVRFNIFESITHELASGTNDWYAAYQNMVKNQNICFIINIYINGNLVANLPIFLEFGTTDEMAQFSLTSDKILQSVNGTTMQFAADGLTIQGGNLTIVSAPTSGSEADSETLFQYDAVARTLKVNGSGYFSGDLHAAGGTFEGALSAASGTFNGDITALGGVIGGFIIGSETLTSQDGSLVFNGVTGLVSAQNLELGVGATIKDYIIIGNESTGLCYIYNPAYPESGGEFINAGDGKVRVTADGMIWLGTPDGEYLQMDGGTSSIFAPTWRLTPDWAYFQNVDVAGKITTTVFEPNHVQAVGGTMIFKPSYKVIAIKPYESFPNRTEVWIDIGQNVYEFMRDLTGGFDSSTAVEPGDIDALFYLQCSVDDYFYFIATKSGSPIKDSLYRIRSIGYIIATKDGEIISESQIGNYDEEDIVYCARLRVMPKLADDINVIPDITSICVLGKNTSISGGTTIPGSAVIGINSNDGGNNFLRPRGLTISTLNVVNKDVEDVTVEYKQKLVNPNLFLGDLSHAQLDLGYDNVVSDYLGYGLYANNVLLNGALLTKGPSNTWAGVSTLSKTPMIMFEENNVVPVTPGATGTAPIVMFAGASGLTPYEIQNSTFQVAEDGCVYAKELFVQGGIWSGGEIHGADIYTARIHGTGTSEDGYGLAFYDTRNGIMFFRSGGGTYTETFSIGSTGITASKPQTDTILFNPSSRRTIISVGTNAVTANLSNVNSVNVFTTAGYGEYATGSDNIYYIRLRGDMIKWLANTTSGLQVGASIGLYSDNEQVTAYFGIGNKSRDITTNTERIDLQKTNIRTTSNNLLLRSDAGVNKARVKMRGSGFDLYVF